MLESIHDNVWFRVYATFYAWNDDTTNHANQIGLANHAIHLGLKLYPTPNTTHTSHISFLTQVHDALDASTIRNIH